MSKKNRPMRQDVPAAPVQREAAAPRKGLLKEPLARCFFYLFPILLFLSITVLTRKGSVCVAAVCLLFVLGGFFLAQLVEALAGHLLQDEAAAQRNAAEITACVEAAGQTV